MGIKECMGRYGLMVASAAFCLGVLFSTTTPSWMETFNDVPLGTDAATGDIQYGKLQTQYGPFNSQTRSCVVDVVTNEQNCTDWIQSADLEDMIQFELGQADCHTFSEDDPELQEKLCRQHSTWRSIAILCNLIAVTTCLLVVLATFTQCMTCGCCGGSFDYIAMIIYWIEVVLSIVAWSFAISVVSIVKDTDVMELLQEESQNILEAGQNQELQDLTDGHFLWGFWMFIFSGTILGIVCAIFADWASNGSIFKCLIQCLSCLVCCKK